jgi:oligoribonuclease NrnB/cAMP/cGMP phosphodiesterase (DHH superfamily)
MTIPESIFIYHGNCSDGTAAAWAVWSKFGDSVSYYEAHYGGPLPDIYKKNVVFLDFCPKRDVLKVLCQYAETVTVLDHHKSALDDIWDLPGTISDLDISKSTVYNSGAMIAWRTYHPTKKPPLLTQYVQDRDLWRFELENSQEINTALYSYPRDMIMYDELNKRLSTKKGRNELVKEGSAIIRYKTDIIDSIIKASARVVEFEGFSVPFIDCPGMLVSDLGSEMLSGNRGEWPFVLMYHDTDKGRSFSLRARGQVDVSELAFKHGGGGHPNAAGFRVDKKHLLAQL